MIESFNNKQEAPAEELIKWMEGLTENEKREVGILVSTYGYSDRGAPELLLLNSQGLEALKNLIAINGNPAQVIDGYEKLSGDERGKTLSHTRTELRRQLEDSLHGANDKLYDYEDSEIAELQKRAEALFTAESLM